MSLSQLSFCYLCNKNFASNRNLKIHEERLHQVCNKPNFICNFCNTGFEHYIYYEAHFSARLKRSMAKKGKQKNNFAAAENKRVRFNLDLDNNNITTEADTNFDDKNTFGPTTDDDNKEDIITAEDNNNNNNKS